MLYVPKAIQTCKQVFSTTARPAAAQGVAVTPGSGADGSWYSLFTALANEAYGLYLCINTNNTGSASRNTIIDIGIDEAGGSSYVELIPDIICGNASGYVVGGGMWYFFPIFIKAGATVGVRGNSTVTTAFNVYGKLLQNPANQLGIRAGSYCEAIGTSGNAGTTLTSGASSEGSWTSLGTTSKKLWWWQIGAQVVSSDTSHNASVYHLDLAVGNGSIYDIILENILFLTTAAEIGTLFSFANGAEYEVPAGSTLYMRAQCSGTADSLRVKAYGIGG